MHSFEYLKLIDSIEQLSHNEFGVIRLGHQDRDSSNLQL